MSKTVQIISSAFLASALFADPASAGTPWTDIGKDQLATYGPAELFVGKLARQGDHMVSGELHAVLDDPWHDPNDSGSFSEIYFRVLADCRGGTVAVHSTWPEGPDETSISARDLRRPAPGTSDERLLKVYCR